MDTQDATTDTVTMAEAANLPLSADTNLSAAAPQASPIDLTALAEKIMTDGVNAALAKIATPSQIPAAVLAVAEADVKPLLTSKTKNWPDGTIG